MTFIMRFFDNIDENMLHDIYLDALVGNGHKYTSLDLVKSLVFVCMSVADTNGRIKLDVDKRYTQFCSDICKELMSICNFEKITSSVTETYGLFRLDKSHGAILFCFNDDSYVSLCEYLSCDGHEFMDNINIDKIHLSD